MGRGALAATAPRRVLSGAGGGGRPRRRTDRLVGNKGYSYERCRALRRHSIPHVAPERDDQRARRAHRPGRWPAFDRETYRRRNVVARCVNRLKQ